MSLVAGSLLACSWLGRLCCGLSGLLFGGGCRDCCDGHHGGRCGCSSTCAVSDACAGGRNPVDVVAVVELCRDGGCAGRAAGEQLGTKRLSLFHKARINHVAVASVMLAARQLVGHNNIGKGVEQNADLHFDGSVLVAYSIVPETGMRCY